MKKTLIPLILLPTFLLNACAPVPFNVSDVVNSKKIPLYPEKSNINLSLSSGDKLDYREQTCWNSGWGSKGAQINYETVQEKSSENYSFYLDKANKHFEGLRGITVRNDKLHIYFVGKAEVEEYSAPIYRTVKKSNYEARPGSTLFLSLLGLGIPLLVNPSGTAKRAFGCTDENVLRKYAAIDLKEKTGNLQWTDFHKTQKVVISGLGKDFEYSAMPSNVNGEVIVDLKEHIARNEFKETSTIQVSCLTCVLELSKEESIVGFATKNLTTSYDFRPLKAQIFERIRQEQLIEEKRKQEKIRLEKEAEDARRKIEQEQIEQRKQKEKQDQIFKL
jgi:hypothetical protein